MFVREEASCILAYVFYAACYIAESRKKRKPSTAGSLTIGSLHVMDLDEGESLKTLEVSCFYVLLLFTHLYKLTNILGLYIGGDRSNSPRCMKALYIYGL